MENLIKFFPFISRCKKKTLPLTNLCNRHISPPLLSSPALFFPIWASVHFSSLLWAAVFLLGKLGELAIYQRALLIEGKGAIVFLLLLLPFTLALRIGFPQILNQSLISGAEVFLPESWNFTLMNSRGLSLISSPRVVKEKVSVSFFPQNSFSSLINLISMQTLQLGDWDFCFQFFFVRFELAISAITKICLK